MAQKHRNIKLSAWDIGAIEHALRNDTNNLEKRSLLSLVRTISMAKEITVKVAVREEIE